MTPLPDNPPPLAARRAGRRPVLLVTGMSGAGRSSILRALEDLGFEAVDSPPFAVLEAMLDLQAQDFSAPSLMVPGGMVPGGVATPFAAGVDVRSRGFSAEAVLGLMQRLRRRGDIAPQLVFATADETVLLRRYTETRRRHPLAELPDASGVPGKVADGIAREAALLAPLRDAADWLVDTSELPLPDLRRMIDRRFRPEVASCPGLGVTVLSFAFPRGLPREADLVFDLRFLRNPHYDPALRPLTGQDARVAAHIEADPAFAPFWSSLLALLDPLLPRYVAEGKKYLTIGMGCSGGKHRSVLAAERLANHLAESGWRVDVTHRELGRMHGSAAPAGQYPPGPFPIGFPQDRSIQERLAPSVDMPHEFPRTTAEQAGCPPHDTFSEHGREALTRTP